MLTRSPDGCTEAILLAYGFKIELLAGLVLGRLATAAQEIVPASRRQVVRMMITDAGRRVVMRMVRRGRASWRWLALVPARASDLLLGGWGLPPVETMPRNRSLHA
jgi:hypothetical protein